MVKPKRLSMNKRIKSIKRLMNIIIYKTWEPDLSRKKRVENRAAARDLKKKNNEL